MSMITHSLKINVDYEHPEDVDIDLTFSDLGGTTTPQRTEWNSVSGAAVQDALRKAEVVATALYLEELRKF